MIFHRLLQEEFLENEIFPNQDIIQGQTQALFSLDLAFSPAERGQYNYNPAANGTNTIQILHLILGELLDN